MSVSLVPNQPSFMDTELPLFANLPHKVADESPATIAYGRKEIDLALHEMPGLAALREEFGSSGKRQNGEGGAGGDFGGGSKDVHVRHPWRIGRLRATA